MHPITPESVPGSVAVPLWLLATLFAAIVVLAGWAIRRKDARDAAREKRANEKEDRLLDARELWATALGKLATSIDSLADRVERQEVTMTSRLDRLERIALNGRGDTAATGPEPAKVTG